MTFKGKTNTGFQLRRNIKLVSFDVFDTLFHRVCHPDALIELSCKNLASTLNLTPERVANIRFEAARKLRQETAEISKDNDPEYMFSALVKPMTTSLNELVEMDRDTLGRIVSDWLSAEIEMEGRAIFPNREMIEFARETKAAGIDICAISDMYHTKETIQRLLATVGAGDLFEASDIFVSSEHNVTKYSKRLFCKVAVIKGVTFSDIAHIGDNPQADVSAPASLGIQVFNYDADAHHHRYEGGRTAATDLTRVPTVAHEAGLTALDPGNVHDRIASALAPTLCYFTTVLAQHVRRDHRSSVWFMARDGYLLKRLYDAFNDGSQPPSAYLYVSRKSTSPASSLTYGIREAFLAEWNGENRKIGTMLSPLGLSRDQLEALLDRYGFKSDDEEMTYVADPRFVALLNDGYVIAAMKDTGEKARRRLNQYLELSGFSNQATPAVVDVGWAGQIQEALQFAMDKSEKPDVRGYYIAVRHLGGLRRLAGIPMKGLLSDCSQPDHWADSILSSVDLFEDTCRAAHGTVLGYDEVGKPVLADASRRSFQDEQGDNPKIAALQDAILRYAHNWFKTYKLFGSEPEMFRQFAIEATALLVRFPTKEQACYFQGMAHGLDFSNDTLISHNRAWTINPWKVKSMLRNARWKEATATFLPFTGILQLALHHIKARRRVAAVAMPTVIECKAREKSWDDQTSFDSAPLPVKLDVPASSCGKLYRPGRRETLIAKIARLSM